MTAAIGEGRLALQPHRRVGSIPVRVYLLDRRLSSYSRTIVYAFDAENCENANLSSLPVPFHDVEDDFLADSDVAGDVLLTYAARRQTRQEHLVALRGDLRQPDVHAQAGAG